MSVAYVTLVTNDDYALGALALARSLKRVDPARPLIVMVTNSALDLEQLLTEGCEIVEVERLPCSESFNTRHSRKQQHAVAPFTKGNKPIFHDPLDNFCKLRLWELTRFERVLFIDADAIVVRDVSKLFDYPEFAAAPNLYESLADMHRLNSGVFVAKPDARTFDRMLQRLDQPDVFWRRTDQTFLETYFQDWHGLPYTFNALQYIYFNLPELWHWPSIRIVHYQYEKPWEAGHPKSAELKPLIDLWYSVLEDRELPENLPVLNAG